jgi:hypothetical protein|tara:strand:- start:110 stop:769 length:660 start_codon:yes stop_codon:yes gene_type:complete
MAMMAPIPGQSLTDEPSNFAWERPPEITNPNEAVRFHLDRLSEKPVAESVLFLMEFGYPTDVLTRSLLTASVGEGMHSVDVSLIIAPVIEEELGYMARTAGIDYKETFAEDKTDDELQEERLRILISKKLNDSLGKGDNEFTRETLGSLGSSGEDDLEAMQADITPAQEQEQQELMDSGVEVDEEDVTTDLPKVGMLAEENIVNEDPMPSGTGLMSRSV